MTKNVAVKTGLASLALLLGISLGAYGFNRGDDRANCPGKVLCPLTGKEVCRDECPLGGAVGSASDLPSCCRGEK